MNIEDIQLNKLAGSLRHRRVEDAEENQLLYSGDHLMKSRAYKGYIGILPPTGASEWSETVQWLERIFAASNMIASCTDRHIDGVLGREPDWSLVWVGDGDPSIDVALADAIDEFTSELTSGIIDWWDKHSILRDVLKETVRMGLLEERCVVRAYIPPGFVGENGEIERPETFRDALDMLCFEVTSVDLGGVVVDSDRREPFSVFINRPQQQKDRYAVYRDGVGAPITTDSKQTTIYRNDPDTTTKIEFSYIDRDGLTNLLVTDDQGRVLDESAPLDLGKLLWCFEFDIVQMISEPVRSLQRSLNYALTTMNKNLNIAGSRDTYVINAQTPKQTTSTYDGSGNLTGSEEVDVPLDKGGSRANFLAGFPRYDEKGRIVDYNSASVVTVDPVAVDTFIRAAERYRLYLLDECHQVHVMLSEDATASGKSRAEARAEYEKSLIGTKTQLDALGRWMLEIATRFALVLTGRLDLFDQNFRFQFNTIVQAGADSSEEMSARKNDVDEGFLSLETYLVRSNIEDPDAELARLEQSEWYKLKLLQRRLEVAQSALGIWPDEAVLAITEPDEGLRNELIRQIKTQQGQLIEEDLVKEPNNESELEEGEPEPDIGQ